MQTRRLNREINREYPVTEKVDGKTQYFFSAEKFAELLKKRYGV